MPEKLYNVVKKMRKAAVVEQNDTDLPSFEK